jgi:hypothetical protein
MTKKNLVLNALAQLTKYLIGSPIGWRSARIGAWGVAYSALVSLPRWHCGIIP